MGCFGERQPPNLVDANLVAFQTCLYFQDTQSEILVKNTYTIHANALGI